MFNLIAVCVEFRERFEMQTSVKRCVATIYYRILASFSFLIYLFCVYRTATAGRVLSTINGWREEGRAEERIDAEQLNVVRRSVSIFQQCDAAPCVRDETMAAIYRAEKTHTK